MLNAGIQPEFYVGGYALYYENILFDDGSLAAFQPDILYIHIIQNIVNLSTQADSPQQVEESFLPSGARWQTLWNAAAKFGCPVIQNN